VDHYRPRLQHQHQLQQQRTTGGEVEWIVIEPRQNAVQGSSEAAAGPPVIAATQPAAVDSAAVTAEYSAPGRPAPVVAQMAKDDDQTYVVDRPTYSPSASG